MKEEIGKLFEIIQEKKIEEYKYAGVWAMFGVEKSDKKSKYRCLNVGKSKNIGQELEYDFRRLKFFKKCINKEKQYRNQFNELMFTYPEYANRLDWLYMKIKEKYKDFFWIVVAKEDSYLIEKYFAYSTKSAYWVSNGRYSPETKVDIEAIRNGIDISSLETGLSEKINALRNMLDNL